MTIKVFLVSNFLILREALESVLKADPQRLSLVGTAADCDRAILDIALQQADVMLLDIDPVPEHALAMINRLKTASRAKILLLTRMENADLQARAILAGACGVVDHTASILLLTIAVEKVHTGQIWLDRASTGRVFVELTRMAARRQPDDNVDKLSLLTERERKIVTVIAHNIGNPGKAIAEKLHISESTLRNHLTAIYEKLGVENRHGLVAYAYRNGLAKTE